MGRGSRVPVWMWVVGLCVVVAIAAVAVVTVAGSDDPPAPTAGGPSAPTTPTVESEPNLGAWLLAYVWDRDLFVHDDRSGQSVQLTADGYKGGEFGQQFLSPTVLVYGSTASDASSSGIVRVDLVSGARDVLATSSELIGAFSVSPDRARLAYVATEFSNTQPLDHVRVVNLRSGTTETIRTFPHTAGREIDPGDDQRVEWSPDGRALLVVDTLAAQRESFFLMKPSGTDIHAPRGGSEARFSKDGRHVYGRFDVASGQRSWGSLDLSSGRVTPMLVRADATGAALSPSGTMLAYDDGQPVAGLYVFDLETGVERKVADNLVGAQWIGDGTLIASETRICDVDCSSYGAPTKHYVPNGRTVLVDVASGSNAALSIQSTFDRHQTTSRRAIVRASNFEPAVALASVALSPRDPNLLSVDSRIGYAGLGPVTLGMTLDQASQAAGAPFTLSASGCQARLNAPEPSSGLLPGDVNVGLVDGQIVWIEVTNPAIKTISGVQIGSSEDQIMRTYGNVEQGFRDSTGTSSTLFITNPQGRQVYFYLHQGTVNFMQIAASEAARTRRC